MQKLENSKILVTGGAGFIGSNLIETLLKQNNRVICLDNFIAGKRENIKDFLSNSNFALIEGDIRDIKACREACVGVDYVFHQAALGSVPRSMKDPMTSAEINISGFVNMLFAAQEAKVKRFIYAASSSTYGDSQELPKHEDRIGKPLSPYAITKYVNELYAENLASIYGIECVGLRYFNVFGKRQDPEGDYAAVIPKFVVDMIKHKAPVINGDGSYSRDFTHVENVIQANELAALVTNPEAVNTVYNIACGGATSLNELYEELQKNLTKFDAEIAKIKPIYGPERIGDIPHSLASIDKARKLLGYNPQYSFTEGLAEATEWYFNNFK